MNIGDIVVTKNFEVCKIIDKVIKDFGIGPKTYLILEPYFAKQTTQDKIFIPENNKNLIRPIMEKEEALKVINNIPQLENVWYSDQKERKMKFEEMYKTGDANKICQLIKSLIKHNEELKLTKHTLSMLDKEFLDKLKEGICQEFSIALNIPFESIERFIAEKVN